MLRILLAQFFTHKLLCRSRIAIGSTCIYDVLQYDETQTTAAAINHYQQKDLDALGHVIHRYRHGGTFMGEGLVNLKQLTVSL